VKARQLIARASYGPTTLKVVGQAFDGAWVEISDHFREPAEIEAARLRLASAILELAVEGERNPNKLRTLALEAMALTYRRLRGASG
jgi:hypothetical protein